MNLGMRCGYAEECPVYRGETEVKDISLHLLRNVFCNRGKKGWSNCSRYTLLERGAEAGPEINPYSKI